MTPDGRILYTRWEYNDRGQVYPQPLLQMNADGTNQSEFYGGNSWFPTTILHARAIPGGNNVLAIATGHHARQTGKLIEIDPSQGRQENEGITPVANSATSKNALSTMWYTDALVMATHTDMWLGDERSGFSQCDTDHAVTWHDCV